MKKKEFISGEYYHIYNRGIEKRDIFMDEYDHGRFLETLKDFNSTDPAWKIEWLKQKGEIPKGESLVEIVAYCLNPNHYHLLIKQIRDKGISIYLRKIGIGYTMYFNKKHERSGFLFQGTFKSSHINSDDHLKYLSAYVNCNSEVHGICEAEKYRWSSLREYMSGEKALCNPEAIMKQFQNCKEYLDFAKLNAKRVAEERKLEKQILE
ncbi:MAG: transposase [Candidatus Moranbacteria bacterium]|nr:transposase [Candidatus Moranbacteria bacterium]